MFEHCCRGVVHRPAEFLFLTVLRSRPEAALPGAGSDMLRPLAARMLGFWPGLEIAGQQPWVKLWTEPKSMKRGVLLLHALFSGVILASAHMTIS